MSNLMLRYYKREQFELDCETVTPMFLGNAHQEAELRAAPFKALFRYWWRVTQRAVPDVASLRSKEGKIFGSAGDDESSGKSLFAIQVSYNPKFFRADKKPFPKMESIPHPECEKSKNQVNPLNYLAGMGLIHFKEGIQHSYFEAGKPFRLILSFPENNEAEIRPVLAMIKAFGSVGARSRNGWGSFSFNNKRLDIDKLSADLTLHTGDWIVGFLEKDYPHCLGRDESGLLVWLTDFQDNWFNAMKTLAHSYIQVRAGNVDDIGKLDPGHKTFADRHLLGIPLTNHSFGAWGNNMRHASPLHFVVHKVNGKYRGIILHLPHRHSREQLPKGINQTDVWKKVHRKLDGLGLKRASYKECLS
jgi:CRISPR-associated protein Cmr1